jgi:HPt (histidine-containing phosphotransfer) domain-containing protein
VIALFVADVPQRAGDVLQALQASDSAALSRAAHALKGAASNVGASALSDACFHLEQSCMQGHWPSDAAGQVALLAELAYKTMEALKTWKL